MSTEQADGEVSTNTEGPACRCRKERDTAVLNALVPWQCEQHALESRVSSPDPP